MSQSRDLCDIIHEASGFVVAAEIFFVIVSELFLHFTRFFYFLHVVSALDSESEFSSRIIQQHFQPSSHSIRILAHKDEVLLVLISVSIIKYNYKVVRKK